MILGHKPQLKDAVRLCSKNTACHMNQSRKMYKILFPITKQKHSLNVMKCSESNEKLENL